MIGTRQLTFGSLFAGIGGFDLGFERAGMRCRWQVEIDDYANRVLAKHWPNVSRWRDIRTFPPAHGDWSVDVICGGFPCQDISYAGRGSGLEGERSGLFFEAIRVVRHIRPRIVVLENVAALLTRGLDRVLWTLAGIGYDAEWHCIPAAAVGAPHIRDRIFIIAFLPDTNCQRLQARNEYGCCEEKTGRIFSRSELERTHSTHRQEQWTTEPDVGRVANGVPNRVHRLRGLGNAVVPQVAEYIGRSIVDSIQE